MAPSIVILCIIMSLHLIAFVLAIGAESRRSKANVVNDEYDERTYCVYGSDASTVYGLAAFGLLLISHTVVNGVTRCLCFGKGLLNGCSTTCAILFFVLSWITFLASEACLLGGAARNAYHTKYRGYFGAKDLSCATLRKGVFAAGAGLCLLSMVCSLVYYCTHCKADTGGWQKHRDETGIGIGMAVSTLPHQQDHHKQQSHPGAA